MPQETEMQSPPFKAVHSTRIDADSGDIVLRFLTGDGQIFRIQIARAIVAPVVVSLISQAGRAPSGPRADFQPLTLTATQKMVDPSGRPGLVLRLEGSLDLPILIPRKGLAPLRSELAQLEELIKPPGSKTPQH